MSAILLESKIVHYEVLGRGRPVIFLHGWVGSWRYWVPAMQSAAMSFRAYALDLWGFGDTAHEPTRYSLEQQVSLLEHFLHELGIGKVAFIAHGLGALVAFLFTRKYRGMVDRLMAVNVPLEIGNIHSRLRMPTSTADLAEWLLSKDPLTELVRVDAAKSDPRAILMSMDGLNAASFMTLMYTMDTPCLIVNGENDPAIQTPIYDRFVFMPECIHQILLEQCGHFPMLDESARFNRLMTDFLTLESGESPRQLQLKEEWKRRVR